MGAVRFLAVVMMGGKAEHYERQLSVLLWISIVRSCSHPIQDTVDTAMFSTAIPRDVRRCGRYGPCSAFYYELGLLRVLGLCIRSGGC